jgi:hypothetical protein
MFCPKCAAQNVEGASFCRVCGANISLIPGALAGQLPQAKNDDEDLEDGWRALRKLDRHKPSLERAIKKVFSGLAFICVALALWYTKMGYGWWFWMLIPAFSMIGSGVAQYVRLKENEKRSFQPGPMSQPSIQVPRRADALPVANTGELVAPPPSVTEGTTRHLGAEAPTRHFDESN